MKPKLIMLVIALVALFETSVCQTIRYADLKISFTNPKVNTQIVSPSEIGFEFTVTNQGPDTIFQSDTLFYTSGHSFKLRNDETKIPIPQIIAPGDSILVMDTITVNSGKTLSEFRLFFINVPMTYGPDHGKLKLTNEFSEDRHDNNPVLVLKHIGNSGAPAINNVSGIIYPNPLTGNKLHLRGFNNITSISMYNLNMQQVTSNLKATVEENSLELMNVNPGIYFIHIIDDKGLFVDKIIVQ